MSKNQFVINLQLVLLSFVLVFFLSGCNNGDDEGEPTEEEEFSNPCNLPECYVETTTTASSLSPTAIVVTNSYTVINGRKRLTSTSQQASIGNVVTTIEYNAEGKSIGTKTKVNGTQTNSSVTEYSNNNRTVTTTSYDASNASTGYAVSQLDENMRVVRVDAYSPEGELQLYTVRSNFVGSEGDFPQLVQNFNASDDTIIQANAHTYKDCQIIKTIITDDSGTVIGETNNTIDERGLLRTSVSTLISFGLSIDSTTEYAYDCD